MQINIMTIFEKDNLWDKMKILASIFNVNITNYYLEVKDNKQIIKFYSEKEYVGYLQMDTIYINNTLITSGDNLKYELFSDIGNIKGDYATHSSSFSYYFLLNHGNLKNVFGNLKFNSNINNSKIYHGISSMVEAMDDNMNAFRVNFNYYDVSGIFSIIRNAHDYQKLEFDIWHGLKIKYKSGSNISDAKNLAKININEEKDTNHLESVIEFNFVNENSFMEIPSIEAVFGASIWENIGYLNMDAIINKINEKCPSLIEFINETRDYLTIQLMDGETISLYDNLANLCFKDENQQAYLNFAIPNQNKLIRKR